MWNNALFIMKHELKRSNRYKIVSVVMYLFFGVFSGLITRGMFFSEAGIVDRSLSSSVDIIFLCGLSCIGFAMAGEYLTYHRTDFFSRKLRYMRQLPVSIPETVGAKYLQMGVTLIPQSLLFFVPFYIISRFGEMLTFGQTLAFVLVWVYFGACMSVVFAYMELGGTGKSYMWFNMIFTVVIIAAAISIKMFDTSFLELAIQGAARAGLSIVVVGAVISAAWIWLWFRLTVTKIRSRSFGR